MATPSTATSTAGISGSEARTETPSSRRTQPSWGALCTSAGTAKDGARRGRLGLGVSGGADGFLGDFPDESLGMAAGLRGSIHQVSQQPFIVFGSLAGRSVFPYSRMSGGGVGQGNILGDLTEHGRRQTGVGGERVAAGLGGAGAGAHHGRDHAD